MLRFSAVGHFAVVVILATGAANIALTSGPSALAADEPLSRAAAAKIAVVAVMIALAIFNRYVLLPRIEQQPRRAPCSARWRCVELGWRSSPSRWSAISACSIPA